jgi:hypothetical protein
MSKEQTPITAEEYLFENGFYEDNYLQGHYEWIQDVDLYDVMEQYAQAKVLEALEREVPKAVAEYHFQYALEIREKDGLNYYETEVKPKYERN